MQVFEFHFNPNKREEAIFDSFIYEPENTHEQKLGNLYIAGELTNVLPQNYRFLNNLASTIKESYYLLPIQSSPEGSLKKSLKKANVFLESEEKKGNVRWLGNLNLAIISSKKTNLNFTKTGSIKILLSRGKEIMDIDKELEAKESSPLKTFSNIISGKLDAGDKIIILTKDVFELFIKEEILPEALSVFEKDLEPKEIDRELRKVLDKRKDLLTKISGIFFLIVFGKPHEETIQLEKPITLKKKTSLKLPSIIPFPEIKGKIIKDIITESITITKSVRKLLENKIPSLSKFGKIKNCLTPLEGKLREIIRKPKISIPKEFSSIKISNFKNVLILVFLLIFILGLGNYIFRVQEQKEIDRIKTILTEAQQAMTEAENALIYNDEEKANFLYQEAWKKISTLTEENRVPLIEEILELEELIEKELFSLNNIEKITDPKIIFEFNPREFSPQKMTISDSNLYFSDPNSDKVYNFRISEKEGSFIQIPDKIKSSINFEDSILLFSEPDQLFFFKGESILTKILNFPYSDHKIDDLSGFGKNSYLLDSNKGEITKFKFEEESQLFGKLWLDPETEKPLKAKSMAIDGSIWILNADSSLSKYHRGEFQKKLILNFFPPPEEVSRIFAHPDLPYFYLLIPNQSLIAILNKTGEIVKQYQSEKFNDLKDFAISENGKIIYLLSGLKVYQIEP